VGVPLVAAAAPLGEQHHQVDEGEPEAAYEHRFAGGEAREVGVGGEVGRQVHEPVPLGVGRQLPLFVVGSGVEVALREDDGVGGERRRDALQPHRLATRVRPGHAHRPAPVVMDDGAGRQTGHGLLVHPAQVPALLAAPGEGAPVESGPFVEGRARQDGARDVHRVVGEHRDVLGLRVHPEQG
jgi:hypothetical protein